jgi:hypothetical protein
VGCSSVGVVNVVLGYFVTTIHVMGGLELKETYDVPIWSINAKENEVETVWPLYLIDVTKLEHISYKFVHLCEFIG